MLLGAKDDSSGLFPQAARFTDIEFLTKFSLVSRKSLPIDSR
jgi:hypothetical protein